MLASLFSWPEAFRLTALCAAMTAFCLTGLLLRYALGSRFWRQRYKTRTRPYTPDSHQHKAGIPSFGGLGILTGTLLSVALWGPLTPQTALPIGVWIAYTLASGLLGAIDDHAKRQRGTGVSMRTKLLVQIPLALLLILSAEWLGRSGDWSLTVLFWVIPLGVVAFLIIGTLWVVFFTNAVNLTDGLDGLASGVGLIVAIGIGAVLVVNESVLMVPVAALTGSLAAFTIYNAPPARVFLGDTGSLSLGGALIATAVLSQLEVVVGIMGLAFVLEGLSVATQIASWRLYRRRVLRMAPWHHHLELIGWSERQIVARLGLLTLIATLIGWGLAQI